MALIQCPECLEKVSDKAAACPHCGFPIAAYNAANCHVASASSGPFTTSSSALYSNTSRVPASSAPDASAPSEQPQKKRRSHLRLPNGFGSISYQGSHRREPYYVRKTIGKDEFGRPILKPIQPKASFKTYNEAYQALLFYNQSPYDIKYETTIAQAYDQWAPKYFEERHLSPSRRKAWESAFRFCEELHGQRLRDLHTYELEEFLRQSPRPDLIKIDMRALLVNLYGWGLKYDIVDKNYAKLTDPISRPKAFISRRTFTDEELKRLWSLQGIVCADMVLTALYTGLRPSELCALETYNVHLGDRYLTGGMKTEAGRNRTIPIHSRIMPIIEKHMENNSGRLFHFNGEDITYSMYKYRFRLLMDRIGGPHTPHDTRHDFITRAKRAGVNEYALKLIVGHTIGDITEQVYTHRTPEDLLREIEKFF